MGGVQNIEVTQSIKATDLHYYCSGWKDILIFCEGLRYFEMLGKTQDPK